jgi:hypothetical protein
MRAQDEPDDVQSLDDHRPEPLAWTSQASHGSQRPRLYLLHHDRVVHGWEAYKTDR